MLTIFLEHKGTSNMPRGSQEGFFDFSIKREHLYALGFGGWSEFIQREVPPYHYLSVVPFSFSVGTLPIFLAIPVIPGT
jgi:hypothetical protein